MNKLYFLYLQKFHRFKMIFFNSRKIIITLVITQLITDKNK